MYFIHSSFNMLPRKKKNRQALTTVLLSERGVIVNCAALQFRTWLFYLFLKDDLPLFPSPLKKLIWECSMKSNIFKTFLQNIDSEYFEETQPLANDWNCQMAKILRSTHWGIPRKIRNGCANLDVKNSNALQITQYNLFLKVASENIQTSKDFGSPINRTVHINIYKS